MKNMTLSLEEKQIAWLQVQNNASEVVRELVARKMKENKQGQLDLPTLEYELSEESKLQKEIEEYRLISSDTRMRIRDIYYKENPGVARESAFGETGVKKCIEIAKREGIL